MDKDAIMGDRWPWYGCVTGSNRERRWRGGMRGNGYGVAYGGCHGEKKFERMRKKRKKHTHTQRNGWEGVLVRCYRKAVVSPIMAWQWWSQWRMGRWKINKKWRRGEEKNEKWSMRGLWVEKRENKRKEEDDGKGGMWCGYGCSTLSR